MIYFFHRRLWVFTLSLILRSLLTVAPSPRGNQNIIFPHLIHEIYSRTGVALEPGDQNLEPLGPVEYERIIDGLDRRHSVLISPSDWSSLLGDAEDHSDIEGDAELDIPLPILDAADLPLAVDHVIPPQATPYDIMRSLLQSVQAMQAQQD